MKILISLVLLFTFSFSLEYNISEKELGIMVSKKFPIKKRFFFISTLMTNPHIKIVKDRIFITFDLDIPSFKLENNTLKTKVLASSKILFKEESKIYLNEMKIENIQNKKISKDLKKTILKGIEPLLDSYFLKKPIYDFDKKLISSISKIFIKDVIVANSKIKVLF